MLIKVEVSWEIENIFQLLLKSYEVWSLENASMIFNVTTLNNTCHLNICAVLHSTRFYAEILISAGMKNFVT